MLKLKRAELQKTVASTGIPQVFPDHISSIYWIIPFKHIIKILCSEIKTMP